MSFTTYAFLFAFLPLVVGGTFLLSKCKSALWQKLFLIAASVFFYAYAAPTALLWLLLTGGISYLFARLIARTDPAKSARRKFFLFLSLLFPVGLLCFFKYADLLTLRNALPATGAAFFLLPMGISFVTFQLVVFLVEVYREKDTPSSPIDFLLFLTFFPYRTMGPIMSHADFTAQVSGRVLSPKSGDLARGLYRFILGMTKKLVLADTIAVIANNGYASASKLSLAAAWAISLAYTFQLYFDFSGYSDMAVGIGQMLGVRLPQNFDSPYKSESISVFWRRWHMTLGRALTTSVYISLGGNRRGLLRTCLNLFSVMLVSGIWHGESLNFLVWGAVYGLLLVFERLCDKPLQKLPLWLRRVGTFLTVNFLWVVFRAPDMKGAVRVWRGMFNFTNLGLSRLSSLGQDGIMTLPSSLAILYVIALISLCAIIAFCFKNTHEKTENLVLRNRTVVFLALLFLLCMIHMSRASVFLYENF